MKIKLLRYIIMVTKFTFYGAFLQTLMFSWLMATEVTGQKFQSVKEVTINLNLKDVSVEEAFKAIERRSNYLFQYDSKVINPEVKLSLVGRNVTIADYLLQISEEAELQFKQLNNSISVSKVPIKNKNAKKFIEVIIQTRNISGRVTSQDDGEGLPGVNVVEKGTQNGTVTDVQGNYTLEVSEGATLVYSSVGYAPQEIPIGTRSVIDVVLQTDITQLEELVVVGYGTQQAKDLTSAISRVDAKEIEKTPTATAMQALQGRVAGVQVVSNGAPGGSPTVRIRGIGSFEDDATPLYVVDGMFFDNIDFLNPSDIETLSVLKDASASAIYGVRAANGVVIIETKSGNYNQDAEITYSGYYGIQNPQNVIKMSNSQQFAQYVQETGAAADQSFLLNAMQRFGRSRVNPNVPAVNTDWYDVIMEPAAMQNHTLTFTNGTESTRYAIGASYFSQDGLMQHTRSEYKRLNFRLKLDTKLTDWLETGGNLNVSVARQFNGSNAAWFNAYHAVPILPPYDDQNVDATPFQLGNARILGYRGAQNPLFPLLYNDDRNHIGKILGNFHANVDLVSEKLNFETAFNYNIGTINRRNVDFEYNSGTDFFQSGLTRANTLDFDYIWDNFLTYKNNFGNHNLTVVGGYSFRSEYEEFLTTRAENLSPAPTRDNEEFWYLSRGDIVIDDVNDSNNDNPTLDNRLFFQSYFGRLAYNFDNRYLLYGTLRADGNNKFQETWGTFATVGAGWVLSAESFFNVDFIDFLKFRAGWGQLGNDDIRPAAGAPTVEVINTAINDVFINGRRLRPTFDLITRWETTQEQNFGITADFLDSRLSMEADYFIRDSKDVAVTIIPPVFSDNERRSRGEIRNTGFEMMMNWSDNIGSDFSYSFGGNFATLTNEVRSLGGAEELLAGQGEFRQISLIGQPFEAFYGYEINGVFQNDDQIDNSGYTQEFIDDSGLVPGDFFFTDQNNDGVINDQDRVILGSYLPDFTYGFNFNVTYKNFDLSANFQGQTGHEILNRKRGEIIWSNDTNLDAELVTNLWRGEGTSNRYPSAAGLRKGWNQNMSDYFVEDGSYFRIQNVRLSYGIYDQQLFGATMPQTVITLTAERPLTVFDYNGFNPEVANGIDRQVYPVPAIYTIGLNVTL